MPGDGAMPAVWLLGSSGYSGQVAGLMGLPFAFAHHFSAANTLPALELYRSRFRESPDLGAPYAQIAVFVVCAGTDAEGGSQVRMVEYGGERTAGRNAQRAPFVKRARTCRRGVAGNATGKRELKE